MDMVKVTSNEAKKQTTAVIVGDGYDAVRIATKRLSGLSISDFSDKMIDKAIMPRSYVGRVSVMPGDTYDEEKGKQFAITKAMKNYRRGLFKALAKWQTAALMEIYTVNPETYAEAVEAANKKIEVIKAKAAKADGAAEAADKQA